MGGNEGAVPASLSSLLLALPSHYRLHSKGPKENAGKLQWASQATQAFLVGVYKWLTLGLLTAKCPPTKVLRGLLEGIEGQGIACAILLWT